MGRCKIIKVAPRVDTPKLNWENPELREQVLTETLVKALADARELGDEVGKWVTEGHEFRATRGQLQKELDNRDARLEDFAPWMRGSEPTYAGDLLDPMDDLIARQSQEPQGREKWEVS